MAIVLLFKKPSVLKIMGRTGYVRDTRWSSGWGTTLQTGRSRDRFPMVSLVFFIDIILPAALWSWGRLSLQHKWVPGIFPGVKAADAYGWQLCHLHVPIFLKSGSLNLLETSGPVKACNGIAFYCLCASIFSVYFHHDMQHRGQKAVTWTSGI
jgi:hypothetical protein